MTSDPSLNKALEGIFERLNNKRAGSVPPLPTQLSHHHHSPENSRYQQRQQQRKAKSGGNTTSTRTTIRGTAHGPSSHSAVSGRSSVPLLKSTNRTTASTTRRLKPLKTPKFGADVVNPATRIHAQDSFLYEQRQHELHVLAQEQIIGEEAKLREELRHDEALVFVAARDAFVTKMLAMKSKETQQSFGSEYLTPEVIAWNRLVESLLKKDRLARRKIRTEWEVGFDEIAAAHKLSLRQYKQIQTVKRLTTMRQKQEQERVEEQERQRAEEIFEKHQQIDRRNFEAEEATSRTHIVNTETSVHRAIIQKFQKQKDKIRDHEVSVQVLLLNHSKKLAQIEAEKDKCQHDEANFREKQIATEKKNFETLMSMEPDSRKRANNANIMRVRRENRERNDMCELERDERHALLAEEDAARLEIDELYEVEHEDAVVKDARRKVLQGRRRWRQEREDKTDEDMLAADNAGWGFKRWQFEHDMDDDVQVEEKADRMKLVEMKNIDKTRILSDLRARAGMIQAEQRFRSELMKEKSEEFDTVIEEIKQSRTLFAMEWCERLMRNIVEEEYDAQSADFEELMEVIGASIKVMTENPRSDVEKGFTSESSDAPFTVWLRASSFSCFFGSSGCSLLEGTTVKDKDAMPITNVEELSLKAEIMNPCRGDALEVTGYESDENTTVVDTVFSGSVSELFASLRFSNPGMFSKTKTTTRVVKLTIGGDIEVNVYVTMLQPLCLLPEVFVSTNTVAPLKHFVVPSRNDFRAVRCILQLPASAADVGCFFKFDVPTEFFVHPKNGITYQGKTMMRVNHESETKLDFEFDNLPAVNVTKLLAAMLVVRSDDLSPIDPLDLTVVLTAKDDTLLHVHQSLDLDASSVDAPRLRVPNFELTARGVCFDAPEKLAGHIPNNAQYVFPSMFVTFPEHQPDVTGGCLQLELTESGENPLGTLAIQGFGDMNVMSVKDEQLLCTNDGISVPAGTIFGNDTNSIIVTFPTTEPLAGEIVNSLLRSVVFNSNRRTAPKRDYLRPLGLKLYLDASADARGEPIKVDFKLNVLPPVIEASNKNNYSMSYREGAGEKCLPSMEIKQSTLQFGAEARLHVKQLTGIESTDTIDVVGKEFDEQTNCYVFKHKSVPVAWWRSNEDSTLPQSEIMIHLCGNVGIQDWMRETINEPYPAENFLPTNTPDTLVAGVNVLLRSISFQLFTDDPKQLKKSLLVTLDDGKFGRSHVAFDLTVEAVDDPTEICFLEDRFEYRQNSLSSVRGFPLFAGVEFDDPDSDNFNGGYIIIDHSNGSSEPGDHLYLMSPEQQEFFIHQKTFNSSSASCLSYLLSMDDDDANPGLCSGVVNSLECLSMLVDEQPVKLLTIADGQMFYAGEQIGRVVCKASSKDGPHYQIRLLFSNSSKFVSFEAAQYALQCIGYENKSPKMRAGERQYVVKLNCTGLKSTTESVEKITVETHLALMSSPQFASVVKYDEGGKPKPLLKQVAVALPEPISHAGFFRASISGVMDPNDELTFESAGDIKSKDKSVYYGKELVGIANPRKRNCEEIYVNFAKATQQTMQAFLRSFCFSNKSKDPLPGDRTIEIHCCPTSSELEMCTLFIKVNMVRKDDPTEIHLQQTNFIYMSGGAPISVARDARVSDPDTKLFPVGSSIDVSMTTRQRLGENIVVQSTEEVTVQFDSGSVKFADIEKNEVIAECSEIAKKVEGMVAFSQPFRIFFTQAVTEPQIEAIIGSVAYSNTLKADRGTKKNMEIVFTTNGKSMDRAVVSIEVAPNLIDFSHVGTVMQIPSGTSVPLLEGIRCQMLPEAHFFEATLAMVSGHDESDKLTFALKNEGTTLAMDGDQVLIASSTEKGKKVLFATITEQNGPSLRFRCETVNNAAIQALLRSISVEVSSDTAKEVFVEVIGVCVYGQAREMIRVRV